MNGDLMRGMADAAKEAREFSATAGVVSTDIEIVLTELGFVVRGEAIVNDRKARASQDLDWPAFQNNPLLLANAVRLVAMRLGNAK